MESKGRAKKLRKIASKGEIWASSQLRECRDFGIVPVPRVEIIEPIPRERKTKLNDVAQIIWRVLGGLAGSEVYVEPNNKIESAKEWPCWLKVFNAACLGRIVLCLGTLSQGTKANEEEREKGMPVHFFDPTYRASTKSLSEALLLNHAEPPWLQESKEEEDDDEDDDDDDDDELEKINPLQFVVTPEQMIINDYPRLSSDDTRNLPDISVLEDVCDSDDDDDDDDIGIPINKIEMKRIPSATRAQQIVNICKVGEYVRTLPSQEGNDKETRMFSLDCEMVQSVNGSELARFSLIDGSGDVIFDSLVKPQVSVVDYCTKWSGINEKMLRSITTTLAQAQAAILLTIRSNDILIGHSLENDLRALKLIHPTCGDTSLLYSHPRGDSYKFSLRQLASDYLERSIQNGSHDSVEDARAALDLFKLKTYYGHTFGINSSLFTQGTTMLDYCSDLRLGIGSQKNDAAPLPQKIESRVAVLSSDPQFLKRYATGKVAAIHSSKPIDLKKHLNAGWHLLLVQYDPQDHYNTLRNHLPADALCITILQPDLSKLQALDRQKAACRDVRASAQWTEELEAQRLHELSIVSQGIIHIHTCPSQPLIHSDKHNNNST